MNNFWLTVLNIVLGSILGAVIAALNGGTKMEAIILGLLFVVWFQVKDGNGN